MVRVVVAREPETAAAEEVVEERLHLHRRELRADAHVRAACAATEHVEQDAQRSLAPGDEIRVRVAGASTSVNGVVGLVRDDALVIGQRRPQAIPLGDVQKVEVVTGSQWAAGLIFGAILDATAIFVANDVIHYYGGY